MKIKGERCSSNRWIILAGCAAVVFFVFLPEILRQGRIAGGSDDVYHLQRIDSLAQALKSGIAAPGIHGSMCYGYGYATGFFYPDFFLYFPALLTAAGMSLTGAVRLYLYASMAAAFGGMYIAVHRLTDDCESAFLCGAIYLMSYQSLSCLYSNFSISNFNAYPFMPIAIVGLYLVMEGRRGTDLLVTGMCGLILSHTITFAMMAGICCLVYLYETVMHAGNSREWLRRTRKVAEAAILVILLMAFYALPMLEQLRAQDLGVRHAWTIPEEHVLSLGQVCFSTSGVGAAIVLLIPFIVLLVVIPEKCGGLRKHENFGKPEISEGGADRRFAIMLAATATVFLLLTTCLVFWKATRKLTGILQFPNRFCAPSGVMLLIALGILYSGEKKRNADEKKRIGLMRAGAAVLLAAAVFGMITVYWKDISYTDPVEAVVYGDHPERDAVEGISAGEWLPTDVSPAAMLGSNIAQGSDGTCTEGEKEAARSRFVFTAEVSEEYYDVPFIWYPGYAAETEDGTTLRTGESETGLVRVYMEADADGKAGDNAAGDRTAEAAVDAAGKSAVGDNAADSEGAATGVKIVVWYEGTLIRKVSAMVSLAAAAGCILMFIMRKRKGKKDIS